MIISDLQIETRNLLIGLAKFWNNSGLLKTPLLKLASVRKFIFHRILGI